MANRISSRYIETWQVMSLSQLLSANERGWDSTHAFTSANEDVAQDRVWIPCSSGSIRIIGVAAAWDTWRHNIKQERLL